MPGWVSRGAAIVIAFAGVIDPAVTTMRPARPTVSILPADEGDSINEALSAEVERSLGRKFSVVHALMPDTAAVVVTGFRRPDAAFQESVPSFVVWPRRTAPRVTIERLTTSQRASPDSRIPVIATVSVGHAKGLTLEVALSAHGATIDHAARIIPTDDEQVSLTMSAIPMGEGPMAVRATAHLSGGAGRGDVHADTVVNIERHVWRVLVFERRPSWMSTFVRRAIEEDPRFRVMARTVTSTGASASTSDAPATLADPHMLSGFDAIVVGAPETLTEQDIGGLETFMRRRAGSVVLLMDRRTAGPYARLAGVTRWSEQTSAAAVSLTVVGVANEHVLATELAWPDAMPAGAEALLIRPDPVKNATGSRSSIVWQVPAGAGRLIVSGALDAWRARTQAGSSFDQFWRRTVATAAEAAPGAVQIALDHAVGLPWDPLVAHVHVRDIALNSAPTTQALRVSATLGGGATPDVQPVRVWPTGPPGEFRIETRMPPSPGVYELTVSAGDDRASCPVVVIPDAVAAVSDPEGLMSAWATSRGGVAVPEERIDALAAAIETALHVQEEKHTWYPMRSPWWILPFASALGFEWWLRRKRGQA